MTVELSADHLRLRVEHGDAETIIFVDGELDPHTAPLLQREVDRLFESGRTAIVLELSRLGFLDSSGLRVVIRAEPSTAEGFLTAISAHFAEKGR